MTLDIIAARLDNAPAILAAASRAGVDLALACALIEQESSGRNIYGHDIGGTYSTRDGAVTVSGTVYTRGADIPVTPENYAEFYRLVIGQGGKSNGVGPAQITYRGYLPDAAAKGVRLWEPVDNIAYGLAIIARHLVAGRSIAEAGTLYNRGNLTVGVTAYGRDLATKTDAWRTRLAQPAQPTGATMFTARHIGLIHAQQNNPCEAGDTERDHTHRIITRTAELVAAHGHDVEVGPDADRTGDGRVDFYDNVAWVNDRHRARPFHFVVSGHTNAVGGSLVAFYPGNRMGEQLARAIKARLDPVVPDTCGVRDNLLVHEVAKTLPTVVLTESYRHDTADGAKFIHDHIEAIAQAHADGILDVIGRRDNPEPVPATPVAVRPDEFRLLTVDGIRGPLTIKALQRWVGATQDGKLGPDTTRRLQRKLGGLDVDGVLGPLTVKALQRRVGARVDGLWGEETTRRLQAFLNRELGSTL